LNKATEAINKVFAQYAPSTLLLPLNDQPVHASVRPLYGSALKPVQDSFSARQQKNIEASLHALSGVVHARDRLANALGIEEKWWWPTGIDHLKINAILTKDALTGRTENPDEMSISSPKLVNRHLEVTIQEDYNEHGQDRILGHGHRTSLVTFVPEKNSWVIDEIKTTTTDAYGDITTETLTERLHEALKRFDNAKRAIERLPTSIEIRKGTKPGD